MDRELLEQKLAEMRDYKRLLIEDVETGLIGDSDLERQLSELYAMFEDSLRELNLRRSRPFTNGGMGRYAEDYRLWKDGNDPDSTVGEAWLLHIRSGLTTMPEATAEERAAYFALAEEAFYEICAYEVAPDDMERPNRFDRVYGNGVGVRVPFDCVDDGGLVACDDPRGSSPLPTRRGFTL